MIKTIFPIIPLIFLLTSCKTDKPATQEISKENITKKTAETEITTVSTVSADKKLFSYQIRANGKIEAQNHAEMRFKFGGYLSAICVSNGQYVAAGQLLATLETSDQNISLKKAQNQKNINYELYIKEVTDYGGNPTLPNGGIDPLLHERIRTRNNLTTADLQIEEAKNNLSFSQLKSPFAGVIADFNLKQGNFINPNQVACVVYSSGSLELVVDVLETELSMLQKGQKASIKTISKASKTYESIISDINPRVNNNGMVKVKLRILNPESLFVGMNATATIFVPQKETISVPREAIVMRSGKKVVFTEENKLAKWHYVITGLENTQEIEITEGLKIGEKVIISNNLQLAHDSPVVVL